MTAVLTVAIERCVQNATKLALAPSPAVLRYEAWFLDRALRTNLLAVSLAQGRGHGDADDGSPIRGIRYVVPQSRLASYFG